MYDIISVAFIVGFFALCVLYVHGCDRILGPGEELETVVEPSAPGDPADEAAAA